jgi:hypothetical protein
MNTLEFRAAEQGVAPEPYMPTWFASLCTSNHGTGELERSAAQPFWCQMVDPLTKSQQQLRGRNVSDMTVEQLHDWIDACNTMEQSGIAAKARRSWKDGRKEATRELEKRGVTGTEPIPDAETAISPPTKTSHSGRSPRIMYIERKSGGNDCGPARIGLVTFSKTGRTIYYLGQSFQSCNGQGISGNYFDVESGVEYWISGPKKNGQDRHWAGSGPIEIDDDVIEAYWRDIRCCKPPKKPTLA